MTVIIAHDIEDHPVVVKKEQKSSLLENYFRKPQSAFIDFTGFILAARSAW